MPAPHERVGHRQLCCASYPQVSIISDNVNSLVGGVTSAISSSVDGATSAVGGAVGGATSAVGAAAADAYSQLAGLLPPEVQEALSTGGRLWG